MKIRSKIFARGCLDVIPLLIPVVPFGVIFGVIGIEAGLGSTITFLMSMIIFAGSSQIAFTQLFTGGATPAVILSSVAVINSRHFLYSAVIAQYLTKLKLFWKIILSYFLTDQAFIVSQKYFKKEAQNKYRHYHLLGSGFTLWFVWQLSTLGGIVVGGFIPKELGLGFAVPLTFVSLIIVDLKKIDHLIVAIVSGVFAIIFFNLPLKIYIILAAAAGLLVAFGLSHTKLTKKRK
jgi:predicted branched-subunit amino acid permease